MVIGVLAVEFASARAIDDDAQNIVLAQRLHRARNGIDGGGADAHHQDRAVAKCGQQVGIGREQQRRAVEDDPVEQAGQAIEHLFNFFQIEQLEWIDDSFAGRHDEQIAIADTAHGFVQLALALQEVSDPGSAIGLE